MAMIDFKDVARRTQDIKAVGQSSGADAERTLQRGNNVWSTPNAPPQHVIFDVGSAREKEIAISSITVFGGDAKSRNPKRIEWLAAVGDDSGEPLSKFLNKNSKVANDDANKKVKWVKVYASEKDLAGGVDAASADNTFNCNDFDLSAVPAEYMTSRGVPRFLMLKITANYKVKSEHEDGCQIKLVDFFAHQRIPNFSPLHPAGSSASEAMKQLLHEVEYLPTTSSAGTICVFGDTAFSVIHNPRPDEKGRTTSVMAAAIVPMVATDMEGSGRVAVFSHKDVLIEGLQEKEKARNPAVWSQGVKCARNAVRWAAGSTDGVRLWWVGRKVDASKIVYGTLGFDKNAVQEVRIIEETSEKLITEMLADIDKRHGNTCCLLGKEVVVWVAGADPKKEVTKWREGSNCSAAGAALDPRAKLFLKYISRGGGMVSALSPSDWQKASKHRVRTMCLFNQVFNRVGLAFTTDICKKTQFPVPPNSHSSAAFPHGHLPLPLTVAANAASQVQTANLAKKGSYSMCEPIMDAFVEDSTMVPLEVFYSVFADQDVDSAESAVPAIGPSSALKDQLHLLAARLRDVFRQAAGGVGQSSRKPPALAPGFPISLLEGFGTLEAAERTSRCIPDFAYVAFFTAAFGRLPMAAISPALGHFKGKALRVPAPVDPAAPREATRRVKISSTQRDTWQMTGLYVPPAETAVVRVRKVTPLTVEGRKARKGVTVEWKVKIGAQQDNLNLRKELLRWPSVTKSREWSLPAMDLPLTAAVEYEHPPMSETYLQTLVTGDNGCMDAKASECTELAVGTPFGGNLYFIFVGDKEDEAVEMDVEVIGGISAPWWSSEKETLDESWNVSEGQQLPLAVQAKRSSAPFGELEGKHVIWTLPTATLCELQNPEEIVAWWDKCIGAQLELGCQTLSRKERFVVDSQLIIGVMHAGYPIAAKLDMGDIKEDGQLPNSVNLEHLQKSGSWGMIHEFGHRRQKHEWTFTGTTEVTVNIFTLYAHHVMLGWDPYAINFCHKAMKRSIPYLAPDSKLTYQDNWTKDAGIALGAYFVLAQHFGWEPYKKTFGSYVDISEKEKPRNDDEKRAQWVGRFSRALGKDLRDFFRTWKWPLGEDSRSEFEGLEKLEKWNIDLVEEFTKELKKLEEKEKK